MQETRQLSDLLSANGNNKAAQSALKIMTTRERLENELQGLRDKFPKADNDLKRQLFERADEIKILLANLCYQCKEEQRKYNGFYCSKECQDKYYPQQRGRGATKDITYMQKRLKEMGKSVSR